VEVDDVESAAFNSCSPMHRVFASVSVIQRRFSSDERKSDALLTRRAT